MAETVPEGLYICLAAPESLQPEILQRLEKWQVKRRSTGETQ